MDSGAATHLERGTNMKVSVGIICSVLGATIAFYLAIVSLITLPADGTARWFAIGGIAGLSLIAGVLVNGMSMQEYFKVSHAYNTLTSRLSPLLYSGIEDVLQRRKETFNSGGNLNFTVQVLATGLLRTAGSTRPLGHPVRQIVQKIGEGSRGYFAKEKIAGFVQTSWHSNSGNRPVFDRFGKQIHELPTRGTPLSAEKWAYYRPIFERSTITPWSNRIVGTLSIQSSADDADSLFKTAEFQQMVDSVATEVSPYLDAIQVLTGEEKL